MKRWLALIIIILCLTAFTAESGQRIKYSGVARSTSGAVLPSATVTVYLAGGTTPAAVYAASSGGTSAAYVTADSSGKWIFYIDLDSYASTQQFKIITSKDGYTSTTDDYLYEIALPTSSAGYLTDNGSGTWSWTAAASMSAGTVVVVDSTDTSSYPLMVDSATGTLAVKTDAGLTYNAGTGVLTATGFSGPLTGDVTGNVTGTSGSTTGNAGTASALAANPTDCSANQFANAIAASGNLTCAALTDADIPDTITASSYLPLAGGTLTGSVIDSKVNAAGGSADVLTLSGTLGIMDGSDTFRGIYLNYTNANHTGSSNTVQAIAIPTITGDTHATETGVYIGAGWDYSGYFLAPLLLGGDASTTKGTLYLYDLDNSAYVGVTPADATTSWTMVLPATEPTGLARFDAGVVSTTSSIGSAVISGGTANYMAEWDSSGYLTSSSSATTGTGSPVKATSPTLTTPVISGHATIEGVTPTGATGTGKMVFDGTPTLVTPVLGAATGTSVIVSSSLSGMMLETAGYTPTALSAANVAGTTIYNTGQTVDTYLTLPTAAAGMNALFTVGTTVAKYWGVCTNPAVTDKIYLVAAAGTVTAGADDGCVRLAAAEIGQAFACWTFKTDAYDWMCKAISIGASTFAVP